MVGLVLHGVGQPGMGLLLIGVLGLVVLLGGIGLIGLVAHGLFGTPPSARQTLTGQPRWLVKTGAGFNGGSVLTGAPSRRWARL